MSEQQPIIITDGNDSELIAELSTELNSDDLRKLAGKEWLNDNSSVKMHNGCLGRLSAVPVDTLFDPQIMMTAKEMTYYDSFKPLCSPYFCTIRYVIVHKYSGTPLNGHPSTADTHDITDNSESPDCPSIHFNT